MNAIPPPVGLNQRQDADPPKQITRHVPGLGTLHGYVWPNGVQRFYGIPYGKFTKNWTRATLVESWQDQTHDGTKLGPWAMQPVPWAYVSSHSSIPVQPYSYLNAPNENDNKNCLTMNLTLPPGTKAGSNNEVPIPAPVLIFIHVGAFVYGSSYFPAYDGYRLVSESLRKGKPVVYASFNYRLGLFGFLASTDVRRQLKADGFAGNSNFGLTDQQLALEWIRSYIPRFGGDKDNVTIFGESAGAMSVSAHLASRKGKDLFHRAAQLSGGLGSFQSFTDEEFYEKLLREIKIPRDAEDRLERLQEIPDERLVAVTHKMFTTFITVPSLCNDGWFFENPHSPFHLKPPPSWLKGFMAGETRDKGMIFRDEFWHETPKTVRSRLRQHLDTDAVNHVESAYDITPEMTYSVKDRILEDIAGDVMMRIPNIAIADTATLKHCSVPIYLYHFDQRWLTAEERPVADAVHSAFVDFAYGLEPWEDYSVAKRWRIWGPDDKVRLVTEGEDEPERRYGRMRGLLSKEWYPKFFRFVEDVAIKRYRIFDGTGYVY
ncbi:Alpha/Beta hydrolase protein [Aspergillus oleicola]